MAKKLLPTVLLLSTASVLIGVSATRAHAQNESWIRKDVLMSCLHQAKQRGITWKYLASVRNGGADLLIERARGGDVFICESNGRHLVPDYN
jgi:hypothetical protein